MQRVLELWRDPDTRLSLGGVLVLGLLVGFAGGACTVKSPEHTYLLREIHESVSTHTCSRWAADAEAEERKDEIYRAVTQALFDWQRSGGEAPPN